MNQDSSSLSGYLVYTSEGVSITRDALTASGALRWHKGVPNTKWEEYALRSPVALMMEDRFGAPGPFDYVITCRRSGERLLLLGENSRIATASLERLREKESDTKT